MILYDNQVALVEVAGTFPSNVRVTELDHDLILCSDPMDPMDPTLVVYLPSPLKK